MKNYSAKNMNERYYLNNDWEFTIEENSFKQLKQNIGINPRLWFTANVPGTVHTDLLTNNLIEEPFYSDNELKLQWIQECDWIYKTNFKNPFNNFDNGNLVFEGIDTIADIHLNGEKILSSENMFLKYRLSISDKLKDENELIIVFRSPVQYALELENKYGRLRKDLNPYRSYIRKAQYSFGWDWGPSFPTSGLWKPVYLERYKEVKIDTVKFNTLSIADNKANVEVTSLIKQNTEKNIEVKASLKFGDRLYEKRELLNRSNLSNVSFEIDNPELWWPNGEGEQNLYELKVEVISEDKIIDQQIKRVGIRTIDLKLKENGSNVFKISVNGKHVFCKGVNWIPADSFLPRVKKEKYFELLNAVKQANMNIVRVWGGGIYEDDEFYSICDELGLLVWQDFMFACTPYPEYEEFILNIKNEFEYNINRLQYHPSVALWCGNNENEWNWYQEEKKKITEMPGYKIFNEVLPDIIKRLDPYRPYWQSSPFGFEEDPNSQLSGNNHQWNIWSHWKDYTEVNKDKSLFISEFGFQGPANKDTFEKFIPMENRKIQDEIFEFHNKQIEGPERVVRFLSGHLPLTNNWDNFIYLTQLNQAFALKTCLEYWLANGITNGSIIWQLNDCWPVTSWAIIDSELKPRIAYHFVKDAFSPEAITFESNQDISCTIHNRSNKELSRTVKLSMIQLLTSEAKKEIIKKVTIPAKNSVNIEKIVDEEANLDEVIIIGTLYDEKSNQLHRNYYLNSRWKHIKLPTKQIEVSLKKNGNKEFLHVVSNSINLFIDLYYPKVTFSKRGFILLPGEEIKIDMKKEFQEEIKVEEIKCFTLNDYLNKPD